MMHEGHGKFGDGHKHWGDKSQMKIKINLKERECSMQRHKIVSKILMGILTLALFTAPSVSYADWGVGVSFGGPGYHHDDHRFYRWHEHPHYGLHLHFLPARVFYGPGRMAHVLLL